MRPGDFEVTEFADGLDFPFGIVELPDGSLLVGSSSPNTPGATLFDSKGRLVRLQDQDGDGVADGPGEVLTEGLVGPITALRRWEDLLLVAHSRRITVLRLAMQPEPSVTWEGEVQIEFPDPWQHRTQGLAIAETEGGALEVFFNVGSRENARETTEQVPIGGLLSGQLRGDSVYRFRLTRNGAGISASDLEQVASGLRNAFGLAVDPETGDLYMADNGIDGFTDPNEPLSADELNWIPFDEIGGPVEDFGFPESFVRYRTGETVGNRGIAPLVAFQPIPLPDGAESEGPSEIAFAPPLFPEGLRDGLLVTFHGRFSLGGLANEENPLVFVDLASGSYFHLIGSDEPDVGHLDSLLASGDLLYLVDLTRTGGIRDAGTGAIYKIRALPESGTGAVLGGVLVLRTLLGKKRCAMKVHSGGRSKA